MAQMLSGLYQKYGLEQVVPMQAGEPVTTGDTRVIKITLPDLTLVPNAAAVIPGTDNVNFPAGFRLEEVEVINDTAATSGGAATLNIGLQRTDRTTEIDYDGILKVAPLTDWNAVGEKKVYNVGVTGIGDLVGVTSGANPGYLTYHYGTAAFTAGALTILVKFRKV
jgi:hypothetical protein